jgi:REP element-mobilizing transposase RayT
MKNIPQRKTIRLSRELYKKKDQPFTITVCTHKKICLPNKFQELIFKSAMKDHLRKESDLMTVCVMPDHIHLLLAPISKNVIDLIGEWKGYTTHILWNEGYIGKLWQRSFFDHALRREEDLRRVAEYIVWNPVRKGLVEDWAEYPYSWHKWM